MFFNNWLSFWFWYFTQNRHICCFQSLTVPTWAGPKQTLHASPHFKYYEAKSRSHKQYHASHSYYL